MQINLYFLLLVCQCVHGAVWIIIREAHDSFNTPNAHFNITLNEKQEFHITGSIGRGAVGQVRRVKHVATGREFALKSAKHERVENFVNNEWDVSRQLAEAPSGIITIQAAGFAWGDIEGNVLLMEIVNSPNLEELGYKVGSKFGAPLHLRNIIKAGSELIDILEFLRTRGVTHRDLKWNNLIFRGSEAEGYSVVLLDFGVAHLNGVNVLSPIKRYGSYTGMSPELHTGQAPTPLDDLWSLMFILVQSQKGGKLPWDEMTGNLRWLQNKDVHEFDVENKNAAKWKRDFVRDLEKENLPADLLTVLIAIRTHLLANNPGADYSAIKNAFNGVLAKDSVV